MARDVPRQADAATLARDLLTRLRELERRTAMMQAIVNERSTGGS